MLSSPPPPPPPPPPQLPVLPSSDEHSSFNPSILIIIAIIASAIIAVASIHLLLRSLSRRRSRHPHLIHHLSSSSSSSPSSPPSPPSSDDNNRDPKSVIDSLPLFTLSPSSLSASSISLDCAVCLSAFHHADELRLLPACRHAFHSQCIDTWLKSNLTCPLCLSPLSAPPQQQPQQQSESFRVEIGSVSRRTTEEDDDDAPDESNTHVRSRSYSIGSSFEYVVEEEIEAVIARIRRRPEKPESDSSPPLRPPPPETEVAELVGPSQRSWLKEYVDRLASSASSSFSSLRFSRRFEFGGDLERNAVVDEGEEEEDGGLGTFYRWLVGV